MQQGTFAKLSAWLLSHSQHNARQINLDHLTIGYARNNVRVRLHKICAAICQNHSRVSLGRSVEPSPMAGHNSYGYMPYVHTSGHHTTIENLTFSTLYLIYRSSSENNLVYFHHCLNQYLSQVFPEQLVVLSDNPALVYATYHECHYLYLAVAD